MAMMNEMQKRKRAITSGQSRSSVPKAGSGQLASYFLNARTRKTIHTLRVRVQFVRNKAPALDHANDGLA